MASRPVIVVGDGWAALGAVGFLVASGIEVCWIAGSGARVLPPSGSLHEGPGVQYWAELASRFGIEVGESQIGLFLREYRNKAFREPMWNRAPSVEARKDVIRETLWAPEQSFVGLAETRFALTPFEIEEEIRQKLLQGGISNLRRMEEVPLQGIRVENDQVVAVVLGSGEEIACEQLIYADRWNLLPTLENLPQPLPFLRKRDPMGVMQVNFTHQPPLQGGLKETFFASMHKESGEKIERHYWGYFSSDGKKSVWTICLSAEEAEDNHQIAKKLRRLKSGLDKIFAGSDLIPAGCESFNATLSEEQFRFQEEAIFAGGTPPLGASELVHLSGIIFLTDGYGPSSAMQQVGSALGIELRQPDSETKSVDTLHPEAS